MKDFLYKRLDFWHSALKSTNTYYYLIFLTLVYSNKSAPVCCQHTSCLTNPRFKGTLFWNPMILLCVEMVAI